MSRDRERQPEEPWGARWSARLRLVPLIVLFALVALALIVGIVWALTHPSPSVETAAAPTAAWV